MSEQNILDLQSKRPELESYEVGDTSLGEIRIRFPNGKILKDKRYKIELSLSSDAMVGLGASLIRKALALKAVSQEIFSRDIEHVKAIDDHAVVTSLGIYLTLDSCEQMQQNTLEK